MFCLLNLLQGGKSHGLILKLHTVLSSSSKNSTPRRISNTSSYVEFKDGAWISIV